MGVVIRTLKSLKKLISSNIFIIKPMQKKIIVMVITILKNCIARYLFIKNALIMIFKINSHIYHLSTFNPTPEEFYNLLKKYFPNFSMNYEINAKRQAMVNSWPMDLNCEISHKEWDWTPKYNKLDFIIKTSIDWVIDFD